MKSIGASLLAHLQGETQSVCVLVRVTRVDGLVYGLTGHDRPITYQSQLYQTGSAAPELATLVKSAGINVDNTDISGAINDTVAVDDIEAGDWSAARLDIWRVNWRDLTMGHEVLAVGELGQIVTTAPRSKLNSWAARTNSRASSRGITCRLVTPI